MKLTVNKKYLSEHVEIFLTRKCSYIHIESYHTGQDSYARPMTRNHYPRFHIYIEDKGDSVLFDMHLDQKQTSYKGSHAHNAEYDGATVSSEMQRLKDIIKENMPNG